MQPNLIDEGFPLARPQWDFERMEGRESLRVYRQTLMAGLRAAARRPTNLAKVNLVRQEPTESPAAFLERLMEAFRQYTPMDPQADETCAAIILAFVNQAAPDIRRKLQKIDRLGEQTIQELLRAEERVYNNRETPEEREEGIRREERESREEENRRNQQELARIFFAGAKGGQENWQIRDARPKGKEKLKRDQCACCEEKGHWKNECPRRGQKERSCKSETSPPATRILYTGEESD
ncbi:uncharacterized protein LOC129535142 [Moschus berezovskii]|uniref:uncharacterized protein LOC129535142 n=1 Tax=Moschus berezovskii TaxID=68408 RepID=UPI0024446A19|nr:uncharacterized protein LOC129535142 [Moschus berezovskii]